MGGTRKSQKTLAPGRGEPDAGSGRAGVRDARFTRVELDSGAILDLSIETLLACFGLCVGAGVIAWLPFMVWNEQYIGSEDLGELLFVGLAQTVPEAIALTVSCFVVGRRLFGREAVGLFPLVLRALPGILLGVVPCLLAANLAVACCVPYFFVMWFCVLIPPVLVFETLPGKHGFFGAWTHTVPRALRLARGWGTFGRFLLWFLVARMVFGTLLASTMAAWNFPEAREAITRTVGIPGDGLTLVFVLINTFLTAVASALIAASATVHYFDLRSRKEGFDLEVHLRGAERELEGRAV